MPKAMSLAGLVVSILVLLVFGADAALGMPFKQASMTLDIGFVVCAALLAYMSWTTYREQP